MVVSINSWHARLYSNWYRRKHGWSPSGTANLCPYIRAVLFHWWTRWLFKDGKLFGIRIPVATWTWLALSPIPLTGWIFGWQYVWDVLKAYGLLIGIFSAVGLILYGIYWFGEDTKGTKIKQEFSSFGDLLGGYYNSLHTKICPNIELR